MSYSTVDFYLVEKIIYKETILFFSNQNEEEIKQNGSSTTSDLLNFNKLNGKVFFVDVEIYLILHKLN